MLLREKDKAAIIELAQRIFEPPVTIWAYGSRVTGDAHETSDLDLVLRTRDGGPVPLAQLAAFREALRDSSIPIIVEVVDWARIPETFHENILRAYEVLWAPDGEAA